MLKAKKYTLAVGRASAATLSQEHFLFSPYSAAALRAT